MTPAALIDDSAKGGLIQFWEPLTMILCMPKDLNVSNIGPWLHLDLELRVGAL